MDTLQQTYTGTGRDSVGRLGNCAGQRNTMQSSATYALIVERRQPDQLVQAAAENEMGRYRDAFAKDPTTNRDGQNLVTMNKVVIIALVESLLSVPSRGFIISSFTQNDLSIETPTMCHAVC